MPDYIRPVQLSTDDDASPAEIRAGLVPEERAQFDRAWQDACQAAATTLNLTEIRTTLESYRRHTVLVAHLGPDGYRQMLARAEETLRTGKEPSGGVSVEQIRAMIKKRLAESSSSADDT